MTTLLNASDLYLPNRRRATPPRRGILSRCGGSLLLVVSATVGAACTSAPNMEVETGYALAPMPEQAQEQPAPVVDQRDLRRSAALVMMPVLPGGSVVSNVVQALNLDDRHWPTLLLATTEEAMARTTLATFARLTVGWPEVIFAAKMNSPAEGKIDSRWFGPSLEANTHWLTSIAMAGWVPEVPLEGPWAMEQTPVAPATAADELASIMDADDPLYILLAAAWPIDSAQSGVFALDTLRIEPPAPLAPMVRTPLASASADRPEPARIEPMTASKPLAPVPAMRRPVAIEFLIPLIAMAFLIFVVMVPAVCAAAPRFIVPSTSTGYPPARASPRKTNGRAPARPSLSAIARAVAAFPAY